MKFNLKPEDIERDVS